MIPARFKKNAIYKMALSKDETSLIFGDNAFISKALKDGFYWSEPIGIEKNVNDFDIVFDVGNKLDTMVLEVKKESFATILRQFNKWNEKMSMIVVFSEISREMILPFMGEKSNVFLTTSIEDDFVKNLIIQKSLNGRQFSDEVINYMSYMEV